MADLLAESIQAGFILRKHQPSNWSPTETRWTSIRASVIALSLQLELSVKQNAILNTIWNMGMHFNIMEKNMYPSKSTLLLIMWAHCGYLQVSILQNKFCRFFFFARSITISFSVEVMKNCFSSFGKWGFPNNR